jgi:hypothetical protein
MDIKKVLQSLTELSEAQMQVPTKGPDGKPIPGQPPVQLRTNFSGPDGNALNAALTSAVRTGGITAMVPDNRTETAAKVAALAAAKKAAMSGQSPSVKEDMIDEDDGDTDLSMLRRMAGLAEQDDEEVKPTAGGAGDLNAGNPAAGVSTATAPTTPEPPTAPTAPTSPTPPEPPKSPSQQDIERQGKTGAELMYTSGGQFMNKNDRLSQEKVDSVLGKNADGTSKFKAGSAASNLALADYFKKAAQTANTAQQTNTSNTTSNTQNSANAEPAAPAAPVEPASPAPTASASTPAPTATASPPAQPELNVGGVSASNPDAVAQSREKLSDIGAQAASSETPATVTAEPAANAPKVSYRERGPRGSVLSRNRNVSADAFRRNMTRGDYGPIDFTLKDKDGKVLRKIKQGDPEFVKYLDQYTNRLKEQEMLGEKWAGNPKINQTGQYSGKTIKELQAMLSKIKASGPHEEGSTEDKRRKQIQFAIRAKKDWKDGVNEAEIPNQGADYGAGLGAGRSDNVLESEDILEDVETSYQVQDPATGKIEKVSQEKYDELVKKGEIDANVPLDYAFKVRNKNGELETVTYDSDPERWARIASKNADFLGNLNTRLGSALAGNQPSSAPAAEPAATEPAAGDAELDAIKKNAGLPSEPAVPAAANVQPQLNVGGVDSYDTDAVAASREKLSDIGAQASDEPADDENKPGWFRKLFNIGKDDQGYYLGTQRGKDVKPEPAATQNYNFDDIDALVGLPKGTISEKAPPGREKQVKALKRKVDNPYAVAWASYNKSKAKESVDFDINNRHKVNESMNFKKLKAAYQEGYAHGLREMGSRFKHYEDMEEAKQYFEGYKCGLEECYGLQPNRGLVDEQSAQDVVDNMASFGAEEGSLAEMDKTEWMKHKAQSTPGDTFKAFGQTFKDKEVLEMDQLAFEALDKKLNALINEDVEQTPVNEGLSVSMSTGQQGSPDSVSVTATDDDSAKLLDFIKQVGLGGLGGAEGGVVSAEPAVAVVSDYGGPKFAGHGDDMSSLLSKLTGIESAEDNHDHDHDHAEPCNECGMMEAKCECDKEKVKETQTVDQSEEMVAEDDGEGTIQAGAQEAEINASMPARGGAVNESVEVIEQQKKDDDAVDAAGPVDYEPETDMKDMLGKLDDISNKSDNSFSNTSSYEVDGKPATQDEYNKAIANFKMPSMPAMPDMLGNNPAMSNMQTNFADIFKNMQGLSGFSKGMAGRLGNMGNMGQGDEKYITLPNGSKVNMKDFDQYILPPVDVTSKRATPKDQDLPGDRQLGDLLNLSGANTYDELAAWLKNRGRPDDLQPVTIQSKKKNFTSTIPPGEDELQPVKVTGKRVPVPGDDEIVDSDMESIKAQLDAMMKGLGPIGNVMEESTAEKDDKAEVAAKKVAKDIEYDEGHKGKDDNRAEKAGNEVKKDIEYDDKKDKKLDEWANNAGQKGTDQAFERDIEFMTKVIAGGLNKPKATGQTTIPVIAGQEARIGDEDVQAWKKLAGLQK